MADKSLGQHWLQNPQILEAIVEYADITKTDTVLEVGPGLGTLTRQLIRLAGDVIAVEFDPYLAAKLPGQIDSERLKVINQDILKFNFDELPAAYKVVANIPYYLTSNLLRRLSEANNPPSLMVLLVQKEVAERICAQAGQMSMLSVSVQLFYEAKLGIEVPKEFFQPPPKVDSQVVILRRHPEPMFTDLDDQKLFRVARAGFSERRKKLRSSLAGGLGLDKERVDELLIKARVDGDLRAQNLSLDNWHDIASNLE